MGETRVVPKWQVLTVLRRNFISKNELGVYAYFLPLSAMTLYLMDFSFLFRNTCLTSAGGWCGK